MPSSYDHWLEHGHPRFKQDTCPDCNGSGIVECQGCAECEQAEWPKPHMVECKTCDGSGKVPAGEGGDE